MCCPFLREATVDYCQEAPAAKALPHDAIDAASDRCRRPDHVNCPYAAGHEHAQTAPPRCPSLAERQVQYCAAVSSPKFIPSIAILPSRCLTDAYRHCTLFLERSGRRPDAPLASGLRGVGEPAESVNGFAVPLDLSYTTNHLWADRGADGTCTIGVDGFLVRVIGRADRVTFVSSGPGAQPCAVLSVAGIELPLAFPYRLGQVVINYALRIEPERLSDDPYGSGWLLEGYWPGDLAAEVGPAHRLVRSREAVGWMRAEVERLSVLVHDQLGARSEGGLRSAADGGTFAAGIARALRREDAMRLFSEFFPAPPTRWRA